MKKNVWPDEAACSANFKRAVAWLYEAIIRVYTRECLLPLGEILTAPAALPPAVTEPEEPAESACGQLLGDFVMPLLGNSPPN